MPSKFLILFFLVISCWLSGCDQGGDFKVISSQQSKKAKPDKAADNITVMPVISQEANQTEGNPFLTLEEVEKFKNTDTRQIIDNLDLTAVFYSSPEKSKAIIAGRILKVGDMVDGKKISEINAEEVVLKDDNGNYVVKLKGVNQRRE